MTLQPHTTQFVLHSAVSLLCSSSRMFTLTQLHRLNMYASDVSKRQFCVVALSGNIPFLLF